QDSKMADDQNKQLSGPDLNSGVAFSKLEENQPLLGHYEGEPVILVRRGDEIFATSATCTHYSGPLAEGLRVGDTVRCPWHHARFDLRTGEAVGAPAFTAVGCWRIEQRDGKVFVLTKLEAAVQAPAGSARLGPQPGRIVIVGGGAAGFAAADMLRRQGFDGSLAMLSSD